MLSLCIVKKWFLLGRVCSFGNPRILAMIYTTLLRSIQLSFTPMGIYIGGKSAFLVCRCAMYI